MVINHTQDLIKQNRNGLIDTHVPIQSKSTFVPITPVPETPISDTTHAEVDASYTENAVETEEKELKDLYDFVYSDEHPCEPGSKDEISTYFNEPSTTSNTEGGHVLCTKDKKTDLTFLKQSDPTMCKDELQDVMSQTKKTPINVENQQLFTQVGKHMILYDYDSDTNKNEDDNLLGYESYTSTFMAI
jgi:hypothetical protein